MPEPPRRSPLHDRHLALGAKLAEFGGWTMPLEYAGGGVLKEHTTVRKSAGIFDVSHLGKLLVIGSGAAAYVNSSLTNDLARIDAGRAQYSLCCDQATGGIVDDLITYLRDDSEVLLIPNAANAAEVASRLRQDAPAGVQVADVHADYAVLAVQGRNSDHILDEVGLPHGHGYMSFVEAGFAGEPLTVCRTGYTGERGYELVMPSPAAPTVWDALLLAGRRHGMVPCGLGARDTLRTEMGYPLHGQDISLDVTPVQARLGWAVGWGKETFWGREALMAQREAVPSLVLRGLVAEGRGIPRPRMEVHDAEGAAVGRITSGTFSPTLRKGVGLGLLEASLPEGGEVFVDVRGRRQAFTVSKPPFVEPAVR